MLAELYGWTMDEIVAKIGKRNNCTFCGVFRRQALDRGAMLLGAQKIVTGHNADDMAETVLLNLLRGDVGRLGRCTNVLTSDEGEGIPRAKPFKFTYEKEIVMYAHFKKLDYFTTECMYAPYAARGHAREFVKDLEAIRPAAIVDLIHSGESFRSSKLIDRAPPPGKCTRCGFTSSRDVCKACLLLEGLETGDYSIGVRRPRGNKKKNEVKEETKQEKVEACSGCCEKDCACGAGQIASAVRDLEMGSTT